MNTPHTEEAFFALLRAGLWEDDVRLLPYGAIDLAAILDMAKGQAVVGLVAAGLEHIADAKPPKSDVMPFVVHTFMLEQRNQAMNRFIGVATEKMRKAGIETLLVKGQAVAQCYERPLWRVSGDVDLFMSDDNYVKAKRFLTPLASSVEEEHVREKHLALTLDSWEVELHARLYCGISPRIDRELDDVYADSFGGGNVRTWDNNGVQVLLLAVENDVFYVFTHIMQHFYKGGIGLRQICDWCRLMWTYRHTMDLHKLEARLRRAGLMTSWRAFAAFAVGWLGMEPSAVPFYSDEPRWRRKAARIKDFVVMSGNFGHNRDNTYYGKYPYVVRKAFSLARRMGDVVRHARIFPADALRFMPTIVLHGVRSALRGE